MACIHCLLRKKRDTSGRPAAEVLGHRCRFYNSFERGEKRHFFRLSSIGATLSICDSTIVIVQAESPRRSSLRIRLTKAHATRIVASVFALLRIKTPEFGSKTRSRDSHSHVDTSRPGGRCGLELAQAWGSLTWVSAELALGWGTGLLILTCENRKSNSTERTVLFL